MSGNGRGPILPVGSTPGVPSKDGLRLILAGTTYLLVICGLQFVIATGSLGGGIPPLPANATDVRDVVALFGWVGLMISGVSVIIIPNHLRVLLRPRLLPRLHLVLANVGLVGYLAISLAVPEGEVAYAFLALISGSFLVFGAGVLGTIVPFAGRSDPALRGSEFSNPGTLSKARGSP